MAIIQTGDYGECVDHVKHILQAAGAEVRSTTIVSLNDDNADSRAAVAVQAITGETTLQDPGSRALQILANSLVSGTNTNAIAVLEAKGVIASSGDYSKRTSCVVLVGGSRESEPGLPKAVDAVLLGDLKAAGVVDIVGVESSDAEISYIPTYRAAGISTVDNIDELMGQISLVYVLDGESGNFGVKDTADSLVTKKMETGEWAKK